MLTSAGLGLPSRAGFTNDTGQVDEAAYANELLDRVASLGQVLTPRTATDRLAAALPLLDLADRPLGSGPYRVVGPPPGRLGGPRGGARPSAPAGGHPAHLAPGRQPTRPSPPPACCRAMSTGSCARTPSRPPRSTPPPASAAGLRPLPSQWTHRVQHPPGPAVRGCPRATGVRGMCRPERPDRPGGAGRPIAGHDAPSRPVPGPWTHRRRRPAMSRRRTGCWTPRAGSAAATASGCATASVCRPRSRCAPARPACWRFAHSVATQLRDCGIELQVQELDLTGDSLFEQLRWPNDFDTLLTMRGLGLDPDADLEAFESSHATSADQEVDANPGGYSSSTADQLIRRSARDDGPGGPRRTCMAGCRMCSTGTCPRGRSGTTRSGRPSRTGCVVPTAASTPGSRASHGTSPAGHWPRRPPAGSHPRAP